MKCHRSGEFWKRGSFSGNLIYLFLIGCTGLIIKHEFFAEEKTSVDGVPGIPASYGEPISKSAIPRPR